MQMESNLSIPYNFKPVGPSKFEFVTDFRVTYSVTFAKGDQYFPNHVRVGELLQTVYFQVQNNLEDKIPIDPRVGATISFIVLQYFERNPQGALFFIHDGSDGKERGRKQKFEAWFRKVGAEHLREENTEITLGRISILTSILFPKNHPLADEIVEAFEGMGNAAAIKPDQEDL